MKNCLIILILMFVIGSVSAEPITITPVEKISTSKKDFQIGNTYKFEDIKNGNIYTGCVTYYRPNGMLGQEAQIEISNFTNEKDEFVSGKITIVPNNHKAFQEFMNYFTLTAFAFVRGSEVCLLPEKHRFIINNTDIQNEKLVVTIKPKEEIATCYDELDCSDVVEFITVNDSYKNGKLYIKSGTPIYGIIDSIDENGWCADNAALYFKKFITKDVNNKKTTINSDLTIDGFEIIKFKSKRIKQFFNYFSTFVRGKEVDIKQYDENIKFVLIGEK